MGDMANGGTLPSSPMEEEDTNNDEDHIIMTCISALGERNEFGSASFKVGELKGKITGVKDVWIRVKCGLERRTIRSPPDIMEPLTRVTGWCIFHSQFIHIEETVKQGLVTVFNEVGELVGSFDYLKKLCSGLATVCRNPWGYDAFTNLRSKEQVTAEIANSVWDTEGCVLLESRLEMLGLKPNPLKNPASSPTKLIKKILQVLLWKGSELYPKWTQEDGQSTNSTHSMNRSQYLEYLEIFILQWIEFKDNRVVDIDGLQDLCPDVASYVMEELKERLNAGVKGRLIPYFWEGKNIDILVPFVEDLLPKILGRSHQDITGVRSCIKFAIDLCRSTVKDDDSQLDHLSKFFSDKLFVDRCERIPVTDYIYWVADEILTQFSETQTRVRELYLDIYVRGINRDLNLHDKYKAKNEKERQKEQNLRIASKFLLLSQHLSYNATMCEKLKLTSFSRNPSHGLFEEIFETPSPPSVPSSEDTSKEISTALIQDLDDLSFRARYAGLVDEILHDKEQVKGLCKQLLEGKIDLLAEPDLEFAKPDNYEKFQHLQPQYDGMEDGIEKGFYNPQKRKSLMNANLIKRKKFSLNNKSWKTQNGMKNFQGLAIHQGKKKGSSAFTSAKRLKEAKKTFGRSKTQITLLPDKLPNGTVRRDRLFHRSTYPIPIEQQKIKMIQSFRKKCPMPDSYKWIPDVTPKETNQSKKKTRSHSYYEAPNTAYTGVDLKCTKIQQPQNICLDKFKKCIQITSQPSKKGELVERIEAPRVPENDWSNVDQVRLGEKYASFIDVCDVLSRGKNPFACVVQRNPDDTVPQELEDLTRDYLRKRQQAAEGKIPTVCSENDLPEGEAREAFKKHRRNQQLRTLLYDHDGSPRMKIKKTAIKMGAGDEKGNNTVDGCRIDSDVAPVSDDVAYNFGCVKIVVIAQEELLVSSGPKKSQSQEKTATMLDEALARIKRALKWESYRWPEVTRQARNENTVLKDMQSDRQLRNLPAQPQPQVKVICDPQNRLPNTRVTYAAERIGEEMRMRHENEFDHAVNVNVSRECVSSNPAEIEPSERKIREEEASKAMRSNKSVTNTAVETDVDPIEISDDVMRKTLRWLDSNLYPKDSPTQRKRKVDNGSLTGKRGYQYYPDDIIYKAVKYMLEGKSMKQAADLCDMNRSALCKRLFTMKWKDKRNPKQLLIPNEALEKIKAMDLNEKLQVSERDILHFMEKKIHYFQYDEEDLHAALGESLFSDGALGDIGQRYKIPPSSLWNFKNRATMFLVKAAVKHSGNAANGCDNLDIPILKLSSEEKEMLGKELLFRDGKSPAQKALDSTSTSVKGLDISALLKTVKFCNETRRTGRNSESNPGTPSDITEDSQGSLPDSLQEEAPKSIPQKDKMVVKMPHVHNPFAVITKGVSNNVKSSANAPIPIPGPSQTQEQNSEPKAAEENGVQPREKSLDNGTAGEIILTDLDSSTTGKTSTSPKEKERVLELVEEEETSKNEKTIEQSTNNNITENLQTVSKSAQVSNRFDVKVSVKRLTDEEITELTRKKVSVSDSSATTVALVALPEPSPALSCASTDSMNGTERKRSERINKKPKLDFKSGTPKKILLADSEIQSEPSSLPTDDANQNKQSAPKRHLSGGNASSKTESESGDMKKRKVEKENTKPGGIKNGKRKSVTSNRSNKSQKNPSVQSVARKRVSQSNSRREATLPCEKKSIHTKKRRIEDIGAELERGDYEDEDFSEDDDSDLNSSDYDTEYDPDTDSEYEDEDEEGYKVIAELARPTVPPPVPSEDNQVGWKGGKEIPVCFNKANQLGNGFRQEYPISNGTKKQKDAVKPQQSVRGNNLPPSIQGVSRKSLSNNQRLPPPTTNMERKNPTTISSPEVINLSDSDSEPEENITDMPTRQAAVNDEEDDESTEISASAPDGDVLVYVGGGVNDTVSEIGLGLVDYDDCSGGGVVLESREYLLPDSEVSQEPYFQNDVDGPYEGECILPDIGPPPSPPLPHSQLNPFTV